MGIFKMLHEGPWSFILIHSVSQGVGWALSSWWYGFGEDWILQKTHEVLESCLAGGVRTKLAIDPTGVGVTY